MKKVVDNGFRFRIYYCIFLATFAITASYLAYFSFDAIHNLNLTNKILASCATFLLVSNLIVYVVIKPRYFFAGYINRAILIKTNWQSDDFIQIKQNEFAGYKIDTSIAKQKKSLILYKKTPKGIHGTAKISISLLSNKQLVVLINFLNLMKKGQAY